MVWIITPPPPSFSSNCNKTGPVNLKHLLNSNQDQTHFLVTNAKWKFAWLCLYQGQHRDPWHVQGAAEQLRVTACWSACLPHDSPTCPAQDAYAELSCTMPPAQGTISAPAIFGWVSLRWAMATLHQIGRSKKHCWSRSFSGGVQCGVPISSALCYLCLTTLKSLCSSCKSSSAFLQAEIAQANFGATLLPVCSTDFPGEGESRWCNSFSWSPWSCMSGVGSWGEADVLLWEPEQQACSERKARSIDWGLCPTDALYCGFIFFSIKQFQSVQ